MARAVEATPAPAVVRLEPVRRRPTLHWRAYPQLVIGSAVLILLLLGAAFGPLVVRYSPTDTDFSAAFQGPSWSHVLGTDNLGRDILSRVIYGSRVSLLVAFAVVFVHAESVVTLLAGDGFAASATPLRILAAAALFAGISAILRFAATALHVPGKMLRVDVIGVTAALVGHATLIPTYGIIGAAVGKLCGDIVTSIGALLSLRKQFTLAIFGSVLVAVAAGIGLFGALYLAAYQGMPWLIAVAVCLPAIGVGLYFVPHVRQELRCLAA